VTGAGATLKHADPMERILHIFYDVYNELGNGFLESVYEESMTIALRQDGVNASQQVPVLVWFRGHKVADFRLDLLVEDQVLLEIKCARALEPAHEAQLLHYLKLIEIEVDLLLNFGPKPQFRRFDNQRKKIRENLCRSVAEVPA
jgi:GxxExxY protein